MQQSEPVIKFGIVCRSLTLPAWQVDCLRRTLDIQGVELCAAIIESTADSTNPASGDTGKSGNFSLWPVVQRRMGRTHTALLPTSIESLLKDKPALHCKPEKSNEKSVSYLEGDVDKIKALQLDFIIRFTPGSIEGRLREAARQGIWYFQFGDDGIQGAPAGFWEIYYRHPYTSSSLRRASAIDKQPTILRKGRFKTITGTYSANLGQLLTESSRWLEQACKDLRNGVDVSPPIVPESAEYPSGGMPGNLQCLAFYLRLKRNKLQNFFNNIFRHRHWGMALSFSSLQDLWQHPQAARIAFLPPPSRDTFHADPFGMEQDGGLAILHEQWNSTRRKGEIHGVYLDKGALDDLSEATFPNDSPAAPAAPAFKVNLKFPHHCSYPYIFPHQGQYFCIPETGEGAKVSLYRCTGDSGDWIFVADLITNFAAVDSSVVQYAGKWWLFCTRDDDNPDSHLYLFYADELTGPWRAHLNNPVKMDIAAARPAGTPFELDGILYRPAQDCSRNYGGCISIQKITSLSPERFSEQYCGDLSGLAKFINVDGMHTLSRVGDMTLLDYYRHKFLPGVLMYRLKRYLDSKRKR